uniref:Transient receptor potential cation channel subfamily M member 2 n=1 Tax=Nomascus leucogenys TaxID=61853 RepID=G1QP26_NOMLE
AGAGGVRGAGAGAPEGFGARVTALGRVSNLRRSNSSLFKSWRLQCPFGNNDKQESLSSWIPENIKKKECVYFVESSKLSDAGKVVCQCGYTREQHLEEATKPHTFQGTQWDPKKHVQEMPTDAFGDIVFTGLSQKVKKYVRVSQDTPSSVIYHLMTQHWGLDVPNLLISVTGGAKNFNMKPRLKSIFRRGLVKVAQTTGAWIITGGSHAGVMKQVGEAVRDFSLSSSYKEGELITIGVATWGTLHRRESLIHPTGSFPAEYILDEDGQGNLTCLDSNHSHFILVDDGTHGQYGVEIPLRTRLEKFISEQTKERGGVAIKIPIVCVVLEGGPGTLHTIYNATTNGTPCVVVEGSGRVADVIAQVANLPVSDITISLIQQKLSVFFQEMFEAFTESRIVEWTKKVRLTGAMVTSMWLLHRDTVSLSTAHQVQGVSLRSLYKRSSGHVTFTVDPIRDLLIWAIVQNRQELAGIIWAQSQDCIAAALACSKILKELSKEEEDTDSSEEMLALAEEYEHRAIGVFTECYRKDEERAQKLLTRVSEAWGKTTCLQLALEAKGMKFVSHGGIQAFLTKVWWGQLSVDNGLWRVTLCMLAFPLLLTGLISFREKRLQEVGTPVARARAFFTAPVVVFHLNILSYFAFLCLFAYVLMVDFQPVPSWCECAIYLWLFSLVCEELRQVQPHPLFHAPARGHPPGCILIGDPGLVVISSLSFLILSSYKVVIFLSGKHPVFPTGYDVSVNFNPEHCSPNGTDPYKPKCPESDATQQRPAFPEWLTVLLLCLYLLFTNILLLNLLIAMFNYTFQQVQEHTDQIWKFQRHDLIEEYHSRPAAPPPFILLSHLQLFIKRVVLKTPAKRHKQLKNKLEKNEEAALLSWEIYLKENYLQNQQFQQKQRPEQKIEDISNKVDAMVDLLDLDPLKRSGSLEQRLASLEEQVAQTARALHWIVRTLRASGFSSETDVPTLAFQKAVEEPDAEPGGRKKTEEPGDSYHVNARHLLYPNCPVTRFPVPNEKVPWETEFLIYDPPFYTAERKDAAALDPVGDTLEPLSTIQYNVVDGLRDRRSFHGPYTVQAGLPLNPMGRTGLRGRGSLSCFGPNHTLYPIVTRWRRNKDGAICRKSVKKLLEVLVVKLPLSEHWALPGVRLPRVGPLSTGLSVSGQRRGWRGGSALPLFFQNLHACDSGASIRWQVVDRRVPLYANHKTLLQKVAAEFGAHY